MNLTKEQESELLEAAKPLMKWLSENCHPHCEVKVDNYSAELTEAVTRVITYEYIEEKNKIRP